MTTDAHRDPAATPEKVRFYVLDAKSNGEDGNFVVDSMIRRVLTVGENPDACAERKNK